jgi:hypothetical protein
MLPLHSPPFTRADLLSHVHFDPRWPAIGPHEGREAWLMELGWKPAARFCDSIGIDSTREETAFAPLLAAGRIERHDHILASSAAAAFPFALRLTIYVPTGCNALAAHIHDLHQPGDHRPDTGHASEFALGRALDYADIDIRAFILRSGFLG